MSWAPVLLGLALIGLTLVLRQNPFFRETLRYSVQGIGLMIFFGGLFLPPGAGAVISMLDRHPLQWMGRLSYAAYLWHTDVGIFFEWAAPFQAVHEGTLRGLPFAILTVATTFFIAWLSHVAIYNPILRWRRSFGSHAQ